MKYLSYLSIALALIVSACNNEKKPEDKQAAAPPMMMMNSFETVTIAKTNPLVKLQLAGDLVADQETGLYAKVSSYVKKLNVDIGSKVTEGQVLVVLEAPEIQSQLANAKAKWKAQEAIYAATKLNYDRVFKANETEGAISKDALDQVTAKKAADEAQLEALKSGYQELRSIESYLIIRAPFSGVVTERSVDVGAYVGAMGKGGDKPLLVIQSTNKLRLAVSVPEANAPYLNLGDTIKFKVRSIPQKMFMARISRKSGALDARLRSEKIEADIMNDGHLLKPLMVADAMIPLQNSEPTFFIPKTALVEGNMGIYVITVVDGKTKKVMVAKGRALPDKVEVFGELNVGDQILMKATEEIEDGTAVKK